MEKIRTRKEVMFPSFFYPFAAGREEIQYIGETLPSCFFPGRQGRKLTEEGMNVVVGKIICPFTTRKQRNEMNSFPSCFFPCAGGQGENYENYDRWRSSFFPGARAEEKVYRPRRWEQGMNECSAMRCALLRCTCTTPARSSSIC